MNQANTDSFFFYVLKRDGGKTGTSYYQSREFRCIICIYKKRLKMGKCEYWDAGWCYSPKGVKNNASSSGACLDPDYCPHIITKECRQTGRTNATTNKLLKLSETQMDEPVKYETPMTATEDLKAQIKVLTAKLALLEEMDKHKSPAEIAYKKVYGAYPMGETSWIIFKKGYEEAQEDYKVEEPEELKTLYQMFYENDWNVRSCEVFCDIVKEWMSQYTCDYVMCEEYLKGYKECLTVLEENLKND